MMDKTVKRNNTLQEIRRLLAVLNLEMTQGNFEAAETIALQMTHHFAILNMSAAEYPYSPKNFEQYSAAEFTDPFFDPLEDDSRA